MNDPLPHDSSPRVVITGAAHGVGRACALEFARLGVDLVLCDHDGPALRQIASSTRGLARFCDIASEASVDILAAELLATLPRINVLINAAGSGYVRSLGVMRVSRALIPAIKRAAGQKLIANIAPDLGLGHSGNLFAYAGSDGAFARLSEAIALQTRGSSIQTATVVSGVGSARLAQHWQQDDSVAATILLEEIEPRMIAASVADLAVDCLAPISGQVDEATPARQARGL